MKLLDWLQKYTFPCEAKFSDLKYASKIYRKTINSHLKHGSTTVCFYGTIHLEATKLLADMCVETGLRSFVGKVCMDQCSPDSYVEASTEESARNTEEFIKYALEKKSPTLTPIVTPRFAPTCSAELMCKLGRLADKYNVPVQTHLSETSEEIKWVGELFPECTSYTNVYERYGILRESCVLAHCVHLKDSELKAIKACNAGISHCPNSNTSLQSGLMPARRYLEYGVKVGLGTDLAGGYSPSILDAIRSCMGVSKLFKDAVNVKSNPITLPEAFYMATMGGADVLGIQDRVGNFRVGKEFDALILDFRPIDHEPTESLIEVFEKFIYLGDDRNIDQVYVRGRCVKKNGF